MVVVSASASFAPVSRAAEAFASTLACSAA
jgi:hypothetical protein